MIKMKDKIRSPRGFRVDGEQLRQLRKIIGWTQAAAANRTGYTERLIRKMEKGGPIERQTLRRVLDTYSAVIPDCPRADALVIQAEHSAVPVAMDASSDRCAIDSLQRFAPVAHAELPG